MDTTDAHNVAQLRAFVARHREANEEALEATQDVLDMGTMHGIYRRHLGAWYSAPSMSQRYPAIRIDFLKRQAE
jgi:hypothetical protein